MLQLMVGNISAPFFHHFERACKQPTCIDLINGVISCGKHFKLSTSIGFRHCAMHYEKQRDFVLSHRRLEQQFTVPYTNLASNHWVSTKYCITLLAVYWTIYHDNIYTRMHSECGGFPNFKLTQNELMQRSKLMKNELKVEREKKAPAPAIQLFWDDEGKYFPIIYFAIIDEYHESVWCFRCYFRNSRANIIAAEVSKWDAPLFSICSWKMCVLTIFSTFRLSPLYQLVMFSCQCCWSCVR